MISVTRSFPQADISWLFLCITRDTCWAERQVWTKVCLLPLSFKLQQMWIESLIAICATPTCQFGSIAFQQSSESYTSIAWVVPCFLKLCCKASMSPQASWISLHGISMKHLHEATQGTVAYNYCCHGLLKCIEISAAWLRAFSLALICLKFYH